MVTRAALDDRIQQEGCPHDAYSFHILLKFPKSPLTWGVKLISVAVQGAIRCWEASALCIALNGLAWLGLWPDSACWVVGIR